MQGFGHLKRSVPQRLARRQTGITMLGMVILVAFMGVFAYAGIRLMPLYLNYMKVAGAIDGVVTEFDGQDGNRAAVRRSISRRFDVESVSQISYRDVKVTPVEGGLQVSAVYDHSTPFISNISFTVHFDKTVLVRR